MTYNEEIRKEVKHYDNMILYKEAEANMKNGANGWFGYEKGIVDHMTIDFKFWSPSEAKKQFLTRFNEMENINVE